MPLNLDDPTEVAVAAAEAFRRAGVEAALYGGLALAMYGEPRETRDADFAVVSVTAEVARVALAASAISTLVAFENQRFGGLTLGRVTLTGGGKLNMIDLVTPRSSRYARLVIDRAMRGTLDGQALHVVSPEDFILLKVLSTRDKDLEDARSVLEVLSGRLDEAGLRAESTLLAREIADHDVAARFAKILAG